MIQIGQKINNFIIQDHIVDGITKYGKERFKWKCLCNCGNIFLTTTKDINKYRKSCGCLAKAGKFKKGPDEIVVMRHRYNHYKQSAKRRGIDWYLTQDQFLILIKEDCVYCKSPPADVYKKHDRSILFNGVDRVNSNLNYTIDNCVSCCRFCNLAKSDVPVEKFLKWLDRVKHG